MSNEKTLVFVDGTKGGSGKSMMSTLAVDYYMHRGFSPLVVESDGGVPDVGRRYDGIVPGVSAPIGGTDPASEIYRMLEEIEKNGEYERIVVNLPGNTGVLESAASEISAVAETLGYEIKTVFMISESEDSPTLAQSSLESGLVSISSRAVAVINGHFTKTLEECPWATSGARRSWLESGRHEAFLPELHKRVREIPETHRGPLSRFAAPGDHGLSLVNQMLVRRFVSAAFEIMDMLELENHQREDAA